MRFSNRTRGVLWVAAGIATCSSTSRADDRHWTGLGVSASWDDFTQPGLFNLNGVTGYGNWDPAGTLPSSTDHVIFNGSFESGRDITLDGNRLIGSMSIGTAGSLAIGATGDAIGLTGGYLEDTVTPPANAAPHLIQAGIYMQTPTATVDVDNYASLNLNGGLFGTKITKTGNGKLILGVQTNSLGASSSFTTMQVSEGSVVFGNVSITEPNGIGLKLDPSTTCVVNGTMSAGRIVGLNSNPGFARPSLVVLPGGLLFASSIENSVSVIVDSSASASILSLGSLANLQIQGTADVAGLNPDAEVDLLPGGTMVLTGPSFPGAVVAFNTSGGTNTVNLNGNNLNGNFITTAGFGTTVIFDGGGTASGTISNFTSTVRVVGSTLSTNLANVGTLTLADSTFTASVIESVNTDVVIENTGVITVPAAASPYKIGALDTNANSASLLTKSGPGVLDISHNGSFAGTLYLTGGQVIFDGTTPAQFSQALVSSGTTLSLTHTNATLPNAAVDVEAPPVFPPSSTPAGRLEITGDQTFAHIVINGGVVADVATGIATLNAQLVLTGSGATFEVATGGQLTLTGPMNASTGGITKTGAGTLVLPPGNNATGGIIVNNGFVALGNDLALGPAPSITTPGTIQLNGGGLDVTGSFIASANRGIIVGPNPADIRVEANQTVIFPGQLQGQGLLQKDGTGTLVLAGNVGSTGGMVINQGTLQLQYVSTAALTNIQGNLTVATGAFMTQAAGTKFVNNVYDFGQIQVGNQNANFAGWLAGNGSLTDVDPGRIDVTGYLSPGDSVVLPGDQVGSLSVTGSIDILGNYLVNINGPQPGVSYDQIDVAGTARLGGTLTVELGSFTPFAGEHFQLINASTYSGNFSSIVLPTLPTGLGWNTSALNTTGTISVVPEPALGLIAVTAILIGRRPGSKKRRVAI